MRGIIFTAYLNFIENNFGYEKLDELLLSDDYPNKGGFSSAGNYHSSYLISLVSNSSYLFNNSKEKVLQKFGKYSFKFLLDRFKKYYKPSNIPSYVTNPYDLLQNLNLIHFNELKKLYPDANFPKFDISRVGRKHIFIEYSSNRDLPYLVYGLIEGCLDYFNEDASLNMEITNNYKFIKDEKCLIYKFEVKSNA